MMRVNNELANSLRKFAFSRIRVGIASRELRTSFLRVNFEGSQNNEGLR